MSGNCNISAILAMPSDIIIGKAAGYVAEVILKAEAHEDVAYWHRDVSNILVEVTKVRHHLDLTKPGSRVNMTTKKMLALLRFSNKLAALMEFARETAADVHFQHNSDNMVSLHGLALMSYLLVD